MQKYKPHYYFEAVAGETFRKKEEIVLCISADLEKVFDQVTRDVVWWGLTKLGLQEWLVKIIR